MPRTEYISTRRILARGVPRFSPGFSLFFSPHRGVWGAYSVGCAFPKISCCGAFCFQESGEHFHFQDASPKAEINDSVLEVGNRTLQSDWTSREENAARHPSRALPKFVQRELKSMLMLRTRTDGAYGIVLI